MLYWLIPYLVVYNASDTGNWKYGPEHLFKAEVRSSMVMENDTLRSDFNMFISCRPVNSSSILCRIESATLDNYEFPTGSDSHSMKAESQEEFEIGNIIFQVEFDKMGPRNVTLLNTKGQYQEDMIRAIFNELNIGTNLSDKKSEKKYFFEEKSIINGMCETSFSIRKKKMADEEEEPAAIEGFNFNVPSFPEIVENELIIIEKKRKMNDCSVKPNYFFGNDESHSKSGVKIENNFTRSESVIYLGKNGFSSYTEIEGTMEMKSVATTSKINHVGKSIKGKMSETIRLKLVSIRPATEKL